MIEKVFWSPRSEKEFARILEYLNEKWNEKVAANFIDEIDHCIIIILQFPEIFPIANKKKKVRKCVVTKQVCLYYRLRDNILEIVSLFDSRQDPVKLKM